MRVRKIDPADPHDARQWVDFLYDLYRDHPIWAPPLRGSQFGVLDKSRHPYYQHSDADFFLAEEDGKTVGRICMMQYNAYNEYQHTHKAFFGFFEVIEDQDVARALFEQAEEWARAQRYTEIIGPRGLIGGLAGGVLVEGFDHPPAMDVPYNFPYYDDYIHAAGFTKRHDNLSGYIERTPESTVPERVLSIAERIQQRGAYWVRTFHTPADLKAFIPYIGDLHREAFKHNPDFTPMSDAEVRWFANDLIDIAEPGMIKIVMKDDLPIGFILAYPNVYEGLRKANGRLWPFGWWHLLRAKRRTRWADVNGVGIIPAHQGRGANALLYAELGKTLLNARFDRIDAVQIGEDNYRSFSDNVSMGVTWHKRHRVYSKLLD